MALSSTTFFISALLLFPLLAQAANFNVVNQCSYTVWAAAVPGGGQQLDPGQSWTVTAPAGTTGGRIWARTGCNFDANGQGSCATGDCGGVLQCTAYGAPPDTLAEYALGQFNNLDFYDISLVDGFNVPMDFTPTSGGCHDINCSADVVGQCPAQLKLDGACGNPCTVFKTDEYCCTGTAANNCGPTNYSMYFKGLCPDAYSYPKDDATSTFTCPTGTDYKDLSGKKVIGAGSATGGLYHLHAPLANFVAGNPTVDIWHWRLGHPSHLRLREISKHVPFI